MFVSVLCLLGRGIVLPNGVYLPLLCVSEYSLLVSVIVVALTVPLLFVLGVFFIGARFAFSDCAA